jgi:glutamate-1-semialdehyde 2,1-aminomutase
MAAETTLAALALAGCLAALLPRVHRRLELSRAKHRSLAGHARIARRLARLIPALSYRDDRFFGADGVPPVVIERRRQALQRLARDLAERNREGIAATRDAKDYLPDLRFTSHYRVPFQFSEYLASQISTSSFVRSSEGVWLTDLDGNRLIDLTGSYGVNLFGNDFYKRCIEEATAEAGTLGPVLGLYHPVVLDNVKRLRAISGLDDVSFHMSGTEAVMQAVRLARYHTGRTHLVRFCGAYHGWWEDVQPGPGNPLPPGSVHTLKDMDPRSLRVLRNRHDIACVLINPLQALHPNSVAPADSGLVDSSRRAGFDRSAYQRWLTELRQVCSERGIVLIFDEVFMGFRLSPGGAQEYFGVRADMVTYGKTLGGGLPVGVVCGRRPFMERFKADRPLDICFARGTFNSHPYVMAAMNSFLKALEGEECRRAYAGLDQRWLTRASHFNTVLAQKELPVRVAHLSSVFTVLYKRPGSYNWMLQFYLRRSGLALSWVGSGRMVFSLDFDDAAFDEAVRRFVEAAQAMKADGWWDGPEISNRNIRRSMLRDLLKTRFNRFRAT